MTVELRRESVPVDTRVELVVAWQRAQRSRQQAETDMDHLRATIAAALGEDGVSVRDVAAVIGLPSSSVQEMVKPYAGRRAA